MRVAIFGHEFSSTNETEPLCISRVAPQKRTALRASLRASRARAYPASRVYRAVAEKRAAPQCCLRPRTFADLSGPLASARCASRRRSFSGRHPKTAHYVKEVVQGASARETPGRPLRAFRGIRLERNIRLHRGAVPVSRSCVRAPLDP